MFGQEIVKCYKCPATFSRATDQQWRKQCMECWIKEKNAKAQADQKQAEREALRQKLEEDFKRQQQQQRQQAYSRAPRSAAPQEPQTFIPADMLKRLIMLCHPDKHAGSALSTSITKQLLELRDRT
jgi:hypothetical protein